MSENLIYADLNLTESTRPRLQKVTDVPGSTYAEVKVQSPDTNAEASYTSSGKRCCSRTCVAVLVAVITLLLVLAVCLILMYRPTASSPPDSETFSTTYEEALSCPSRWEKKGKKCYFFSETQDGKDWDAFRKECIGMNSDLVTIENKEELSYLTSRSTGYYYLLGLRYYDNETKWKWINNRELSRDLFGLEQRFSDYFCAVTGHRGVESASCNGSSTTKNMCEKAANSSARQKES
ncbi:CLC5A protein, partial [Balaeniceps rex]|nr:CLC5A protein [Balaeniceps rex]